MKKLTKLLMLLVTLAIMIFACSDGPNPTEPFNTDLPQLASIPLPDGAVFQSATFSIWHGGNPGAAQESAHRRSPPHGAVGGLLSAAVRGFQGSHRP